MADFAKAVNGNPYREGNAVTVQPNIASPDTHILHVTRGNQNKDWTDYFAYLATKWGNATIAYYYVAHP